eukprot:s1276_g11.t1
MSTASKSVARRHFSGCPLNPLAWSQKCHIFWNLTWILKEFLSESLPSPRRLLDSHGIRQLCAATRCPFVQVLTGRAKNEPMLRSNHVPRLCNCQLRSQSERF